MKAQDPSIKIVAPALSYFTAQDSIGQSIMQRLIGGGDDITGIISGTGFTNIDNLKYYIDVVDIHTYGGNYGYLTGLSSTNYTATRNGLISYPGADFATELNSLQTLLSGANSSRSSSPLTYAVTEMNVCYMNPVGTTSGNVYQNSTEGIACRSFFAGQFWADMMSEVLKDGTSPSNAKVEFVMPWSVHESSGNGDTTDFGMTKGVASATQAPTPVSTYYHYQLMAQHFKGKYVEGFSTISPSVKTFASMETGAGFYVMIVNRDGVDYPFNIGFNNSYATPSASLKLKFDFTLSGYSLPLDSNSTYLGDTIKANSTVLLQFNCHGNKKLKKVYSLQDAIADGQPHLRQINNTNVDPQIAACNQPGIGGTISSNATYSNTTVYITSDILLAGHTNLTFNNCIVVVSPNVEIKATPLSSIDIKNNTVFVGCNGSQWKGIYMIGNYNNGERLRVENSFIFNAKTAIKTEKIPDLKITGNVIANGETAIDLERSESFTITENVIGGFKTGIKTSNTKPNHVSKIRENSFVELMTGLEFNDDNHNMLEIACNEFRFSDKGIKSRNTDLKEQGDATMSAGNKFERIAPGQPIDFIDHTGTFTKYYFGPAEANDFNYPNVMNIPKVQAVSDKVCAQPAHNCVPFVGVAEHSGSSPEFIVYPNPSTGEFTLTFSNLPKGSWTLDIHDVLGRVISTKKIAINMETATLQIDTKGIYFVTLQNGENRITKKVIVE